MRLAFTVPPDRGPGLRYAEALAAALRDAGHEASLGGAVPPGAIPVLDGALLPGPVPPGSFALLHRVPGEWDPTAFRGLIATGAPVQKQLEEAGLHAALVTPGIGDLPRSACSGGPSCAILSVGALTTRKGHDSVLRALARLADLDWTLAIAGSTAPAPAHAATITAGIDELGLARRVRLVPDPDDATLDALWREADLFASASRWEAYPAALAEALRRGIPASVNDAVAAGLPPLDGSIWGIVCPTGDTEGLSRAMRRAIYDRPLRRSLAEGAWQAGRTLPGWDVQARHFVDLIEKAGPCPS